MGTSNWQNIPFCINAIRRIQPKKILDVGIGFGRWGILSREFLELWQGRTHIKEWEIQIDGVEIFKTNIEGYHNYFYSNIFNEDIFDYLFRTQDDYDLIILGDVLEHFEREKANELIDLCLIRTNYIILNLPLGDNWQQGELYNNPYERHLSFWSKKDIKSKYCVHYKIYRDYIGRLFGSFILSKKHFEISFIKRTIIRSKFYIDSYPLLKLIIKNSYLFPTKRIR